MAMMREQQRLEDQASVAGSQPTTASGLPADNRQVRGSSKSLLRCIRDGEIPKPPLMSYLQWLSWRKEVGRRPTNKQDGYYIPKALEAALWRSVMQDLHGSDWAVRCCSSEVDSVGDPDAEQAVGSAPSVAVRDPGGAHTGNAACRSIPEVSPAHLRGPDQPVSPYSNVQGAPSEVSWFSSDGSHKSGPIEQRMLTRFREPFQPRLDSIEKFKEARRKQAHFLRQYNYYPTTLPDALDVILRQAEILLNLEQAYPEDNIKQLEELQSMYLFD